MKFGLPLFGLSPRYYPAIARCAEEHGFESVWVPEHLVLPATLPSTYLYASDGAPPITADTPLYDPWVLLGAVASTTESIRLATNVYILPLRHPLGTARSVLTVDRLSGGRVTLGAGVGWLEEEFVAAGQDFHNRGRRTDEIIEILRRLWSEDKVEHHGAFYDFGPVTFAPRALARPHIPIEIGGRSPRALRRAGRLGDGWVEIGADDLDDFAGMLAVVNAARTEAGRLDDPFEVTCSIGRDVASAQRAAGLGATRVVVGPTAGEDGDRTRLTKERFVEWIEQFAHDVIANFDGPGAAAT